MNDLTSWIGALLILIGVGFTLVAAIGLVRMNDPWTRMHAASKPQLLGLMLVCAGIVIERWSLTWLVLSTVIVILQVITAPVGSHLIACAAEKTGTGHSHSGDDLVENDLSADRPNYERPNNR
ncbi:monovalent cation/H(+) antiporter subunit G [Schaalia vaccimaxillae]|uniref:monovalent cation/H(+) antiporter subunit G n=1 Tax=Schaalia vaccimaxillae TaxID=183916 RepID=UPI0003B590C0|nr:monovalent cation/H(+) antiporter subunit G [Schaalia vaccimaxillae]